MRKHIIRILAFFILLISIKVQAQINVIDSLEQLYQETTSIKKQAHLIDEMRTHVEHYDLDSAIYYSKRLLELGRIKNDNRTKAMGYYGLGSALDYKGLLDSAEIYYIQALDIFKKIKDNDNIISTLGAYSFVFSQRNEHETALVLRLEALQHINNKTPSKLKVTTNRYLALSYYYKWQYPYALKYAFESLKFTDADDKHRSQILSLIGSIHYSQDNFDKAIEYYQKSTSIHKKNNDLKRLLNDLRNLGICYSAIKQYSKAEMSGKEALQISKQIGTQTDILISHIYLTNGYLDQEKIEEAEKYIPHINAADTIHLAREYLFNYYILWTNYSYLKKDYQQALKYGKIYLFKANKENSFFNQRSANEYLQAIYEDLGDYKTSLQYHKAIKIAHDSLINAKNIEALTTQKLQFEFDREQEEQAAITKAKQQRQNLFLWIASILAIFLGVVTYLIYRNNLNIKKSKQIIEEQNDELIALYNHKNQLFANISHELQTPLTLIMSSIRPLKGLDHLKRHVNALQQVIRQVLDLAKTEQKQLEITGNQFLLKDFVDYLKVEFRSIATYRNIQYNIHNIVKDDFELKTDGHKLLTIVKNLLSNAFKFTPSNGHITLNISKNKNQELIIRVQDSGKGISEKDLPLVFNRYFQTTQEKTVVEGGMGIGLAICKEYIQLLRGNIQVKSTIGKGSIFTIQFPTQLDELEINESTNQDFKEYLGSITATDESIFANTIVPIGQVSTNTKELTTISDKLPLLVVEDNISMCQHLNTVLSTQYEITFAPHGKKALELLDQDYQPQLIISDLMMPEMDGFKFVKHLKNKKTLKDIPVLMLTAREGTEDKMDAFRIGVDDYLTKPFLEEELNAHINLLISNYQERKDYKEELAQTEKNDNENSLNINLSGEEQEWLDRFHQTVLQNLGNVNFSVNQLADEMAVSYSHAFREVKRLTGFTPYQYIKETRLQEARKMLENKKYRTVKSVVFKVGQTDVRHFSQIFKKRFGKTPSQYLKA